MTAAQRRIVLGLALLDLLVLAVLGWAVWQGSRPVVQSPSTVAAICPQQLLADLPAHLSPAVAWEGERLIIRLSAYYPTSHPPSSAPQPLWDALDALRRTVEAGCPMPAKIVLHLTAVGRDGGVICEAVVDGETLQAWAAGQIDEEALTQRVHYRQEEVPAP